MSRWSARGAVVVVILVLVGLALRFWPEPAGPVITKPETASKADALARLRAGKRPASLLLAIKGRVVDATDRPVAGAVVLFAPAGFLAAGRDAPRAQSGADGGFVTPFLAPGRYRVSASAPGHRASAVNLEIPAERPIVLRLGPPGVTLSGTISDVGGGAVASVLVTLHRRDGASPAAGGTDAATLSDDAGHYSIGVAGGAYDVRVAHLDYVPAATQVTLSGTGARLDFVLTPGARVSGVVRSRASGQPVAGALVTAAGGRSTSESDDNELAELPRALGEGGVLSDGEGRFVLSGLGSGVLELSARAGKLASREPTSVSLGVGEEVSGLEIFVDEARTISGYVVSAKQPDEGLPGVLVGVLRLDGMSLGTVVETDDTGFFEIGGLGKGKYSLLAARPGLLPDVMRTTVTLKDEDVDDVIIALVSGTRLRGIVDPPGPATLALQVDEKLISPANLFSLVGAALAHTRAGDDGRFELAGVPDGDFAIVARAADGRRGELPVVIRGVDQDGLRVSLKPRASVRGRVVDDRGAPVGGASIEAQDRGDRGRVADFGEMTLGGVRSDDDGGFYLSGLAAGEYGLRVELGEETLQILEDSATHGVTLAEGEQKTGVIVRVQGRRGVIRGRVVGERGGPAADVWVVAREGFLPGKNEDLDAPADQSSWRSTSRPVLTDADGRFEISGLSDGHYDVTADAGSARAHRRGVAPGANLTLRLRPLASLRGRVTVNGKPVVDYRVRLEGPVKQDRQIHAADGTYHFERLEAGEHNLTVRADEGVGEATITLASGQAGTLDLPLAGWGEIRGQIVDAFTGKPLSGLYVLAESQATNDDGEQALGFLTGEGPRSDGEGRFRVGRLGPGYGRLTVHSRSLLGGARELATTTYELEAGEKKDLGVIRALTRDDVDEDEQGMLGFATGLDYSQTVLEEMPADRLRVAAVPEGPALAAGLAVGDFILAIDGRSVAELGQELARRLLQAGQLRAGQVVKLSVERAGARLEIVITAVPIPKF